MRTLGIIGTAGRGNDADKLTKQSWAKMVRVVDEAIIRFKPDVLVSGGAAWADHLAVQLYINYQNFVDINLYLPVKFNGVFDENELTIPFNCGSVLNKYHRDFSKTVGIDSFGQIQSVLDRNIKVESGKGFHGRNTQIANASTDLLAFTFGEGEQLKDGGTKDTWDKFLKRVDRGYALHYNLADNKLYKKDVPEKTEQFW